MTGHVGQGKMRFDSGVVLDVRRKRQLLRFRDGIEICLMQRYGRTNKDTNRANGDS